MFTDSYIGDYDTENDVKQTRSDYYGYGCTSTKQRQVL